MNQKRWGVFLDRDGTLNKEMGHIWKADQIRLLPPAAGAIKRLRRAGAVLVVVTNQAGIAHGLLDEKTLRVIHRRFENLLAKKGAAVDAIYHCPHHPGPSAAAPLKGLKALKHAPRYRVCGCRKPKTGMLRAAAKEFQLDLKRSFLVGDSSRDIAAAHAAGCRAVLVRTGHAGRDWKSLGAVPDVRVKDVGKAADWILRAVASKK